VFTQTDPLQASVGTTYPSSYMYGNNNPMLFTDPGGMDSIRPGGPTRFGPSTISNPLFRGGLCIWGVPKGFPGSCSKKTGPLMAVTEATSEMIALIDQSISDMSKWWGRNGGTVTAVLGGVAFAVCVVSTAGACAVAGWAAAAVSISGRTIQYIAGDKSGPELLAFSAVDIASAFVPGTAQIEGSFLSRFTETLGRASFEGGLFNRFKVAGIKAGIKVAATALGATAQSVPLTKAVACVKAQSVVCK
jgi:hypothetical protein